MRRLVLCVLLLVALVIPAPVKAGLSERDLAAMITPPLQLGTHDSGLPVWTLLDGGGAFIGYVFESRDLAPLPGFSGTPINLMVAMDKTGTFLDVRVLEQNEPVFVDGLGPQPMLEFVRQYRGLSLGNSIKVGGAHDEGRDHSTNTWIDGVTKATASVRIINETVLASALKVARERLAGIAPKPAGRPRADIFRPMSWDELTAAGLIRRLRLTSGEVDAAFAGTPYADHGEGGDAGAVEVDLWVADLGLPLVARNLLTEDTLRRMARHVDAWEEPILVLAEGRYSITGEHFVRNSVPDRLAVRQGAFPVGVRDADVEPELRPGLPRPGEGLILRLDTRLGFDPASPWSLGVRIARSRGPMMAGADRTFTVEVRPPAELYVFPRIEAPAPPWLASWTGRAGEIAALLAFLAGLTVLLALPRRWAARPRLLATLRPAVLAVTLGFVGWYGQGQLSIVNLTALVKTLRGAGGMDFLLYDPFTLILWLYVVPTLVVWGRGTFCGWLCPFGALQDFVGEVARLSRLRQLTIPEALHRRLLGVKYAVLAVLLLAAAVSDTAADRLVEVEPFKTAITLTFLRHWPFVAYAAALLAAGLVVYKGFCRYLCPLGAFLALAGRLRRFDWIARRTECGSPCRLCEGRCRYRAIARDGAVDYGECFQCLDCVAIHDDPKRCVPLVLADRKKKGSGNG